MSLLDYKCKPELSGMYECTVKSFKEVENSQGGYISVILDVPNYGDYTYCIFPTQIDYVTSCLNKQLEVPKNTYNIAESLTKFEKAKLKVWFTYNTDVQRMNVALHESKVVTEEAPEV